MTVAASAAEAAAAAHTAHANALDGISANGLFQRAFLLSQVRSSF